MMASEREADVETAEPKPDDRAEEARSCAHGVLGLHGICTSCGDSVGDGLAERMAERAESIAAAMVAEHAAADLAYAVDAQGLVSDVRPAEMTPDRGDVTKVRTVGDDAHPSDATALIPAAAKFGTAPYLSAEALEQLAERLIGTKEALADLADLRIVYRWKAKGGMARGWPKLGGIERISGQTLAFIAGPAPDLLVWLAADTLRESAVSEQQIEAILFDQLVSVEWSDGDEDGDPTWRLVGPEIMCHLATLEEYGPFTRKLESAKAAFVQPSLFGATVQEERFSQEEAERVITIAAKAYADEQAGSPNDSDA